MEDTIAPNEKVITEAITDGPNRKIYNKFTKIKDLPPDLQKQAKQRGLVADYGKVYKPIQTNVDHKKRADVAEKHVASLEQENEKLRADNAALKDEVAELKEAAKNAGK